MLVIVVCRSLHVRAWVALGTYVCAPLEPTSDLKKIHDLREAIFSSQVDDIVLQVTTVFIDFIV